MLTWFTENLKRHGIFETTKLFVRGYGGRAVNIGLNAALPAKVECPCCKWKGNRFFDYFEVGVFGKGVECPNCNSHGRHRAFYLWLEKTFDISQKSGRALIFAPESTLEPLWDSAKALKIIRTDIVAERQVDVVADIQALPIASDSIDLIWCHHILEQVPDDGAAMNELYRVLRSETGTMVVSSGMYETDDTVEFSEPNMRQHGNWRIYGQDFPAKLGNAGFEPSLISYDLTRDEAKKFGIELFEKAFVCCKRMS